MPEQSQNKRLLRLALIAGIILFFGGGIFSAYRFYTALRGMMAPAAPPARSEPVRAGAVPAPPKVVVLEERINVLLLGVDRRPHETGPTRTDTMILVSIDPRTRTAGMLSIPRDLWVHVPYPEPGRDDRINTAHFYGEVSDYPDGGGPGLAMRTVELNLGVPVRFWVRINFEGFERLIDALGGVEVEVEQRIYDPDYPTNDYRTTTIQIPAGVIRMDGDLALKYVRTRATGRGDLDRIQRQQQVLLAIREEATSLSVLPRLPQLIAAMPDVVDTNMGPAQVLALARLGSQIPKQSVRRVAIDQAMVRPMVTAGGAQVLLPCRELLPGCQATLADAVADFLSAEPATASGEPAAIAGEPVAPEPTPAPGRIVVENGTGIPMLAEEAFAYLRERGLEVVQFGSAEHADYRQTLVVDYTGREETVRQLLELLGLAEEQVLRRAGGPPGVDVVVILGADYAAAPGRAGR